MMLVVQFLRLQGLTKMAAGLCRNKNSPSSGSENIHKQIILLLKLIIFMVEIASCLFV